MTDTSHTVGQNKQQSEDKTPHRDATAPKDKVEPGETVEHAAKDKAQNAEARAKHNNEHLGGEFDSKCYFCTLQEDSGTVPVLVPDQPPAMP